MKSRIVLALLGLTLAGCVAPLKPTFDYQSSNTKSDEAKKIYDIAEKCWSKDLSLFRDRVIVENKDSSLFQDKVIVEKKVKNEFIVITGKRAASDLGYQEPFIRILVSETGNGTSVNVEEGDYAMGAYENLTQDVKRWSSGVLTCSKT
ncbi:MAG: hypothetical protein ABJK37_13085 [Paraglaciecola sp.]|uniref:hypothetical protein n=1 Tax=Paraglaciecola sp. TaxID=1920173 RepID=UPI0032969C57